LDSLRPSFGCGKRREQQRRQNGNDGDDDQQFNQREPGLAAAKS
jgi:hypothetical protein